jgi:hypothetical protein
MNKVKSVRLELEYLSSRELPGNLLSLLDAELPQVAARAHKQVASTDFTKSMRKAEARQDKASGMQRDQSPRQVKSKASQKSLDHSNEVWQTRIQDDRLGSVLADLTQKNVDARTRNLASVENVSVIPGMQNHATGVSSQVLATVHSLAPQQGIGGVDELTRAASRKRVPKHDDGSIIARSESQQYTYLDVPINANNDNNSAVVEYIPAIYDFNAVLSDYETNVLDPELIALPLHDETPYPGGPVVTNGAYQYYLTVTQPAMGNGGRIRLWDSQRKDHEYTVFNTWTTQNLNPTEIIPGMYDHPNIFIEGTEPSWQDHEMQITLKVKWDANGTVWTSNYRMVNATVTPRLTSLSITKSLPHFGAVPFRPPWDTNGINGIHYEVIITSILAGKLYRARSEFVQNFTAIQDLHQGQFAFSMHASYTGSKNWKSTVGTAQFPILDTNASVAPYYGNMSEGVSMVDNRYYVTEMEDHPGVKASEYNKYIEELHFSQEFKTWSVLSYIHYSGGGLFQVTMYPLGYFTWKVDHKASGFVANQGVTQLNSTHIPTAMVRSHAKPDRLTPPFANDVTSFKP